MNQLTGIDRAITSGVPGTTRDTIEALFSVRDIPITLVDTAGIGNPTDPIEKLGVKRSIDESKNCDMIINLFTPTDPPKKIHFGGIPTIRVINKVDTIDKHQKERLLKNTNNVVFISALFNTGLTTLKDEIYKKIKLSTPEIGDVVITTKRQKHLVVSGLKDLRQARSLLKNNPALVELLCVDIRSCVSSIDTLLGNTTEDDVLNNIFNNFCVGK